MLYDVRITPKQLLEAARWAHPGDAMADVELAVDDRMLVVAQGDSRAAFDTDGSPGSDEYVAQAPLDPSRNARARAVAEEIRELANRPTDVSQHAAAQSALASKGAELADLVLGTEGASA